MGKKYLLYIHDERFQDEAHKSELVNTLLFDWYNRIPNPENPFKDAVVVKKIIKTPREAKEVVKKLPDYGSRQLNGLCKQHGTPLDQRGRCMIKGCKCS